jgi:uncharacterized protein with PIN domain
MGFLDRLFGRRKKEAAKPAASKPSRQAPAKPTLKQSRQELWDASPKSRCGVCGKELRGLSGGMVIGSGADFIEMMLEGARYVCPNCGFVSCFECCADMSVHKVICRRCKGEMQRA